MPILPAPPSITAVILAGGKARRMGGVDKALLPLQGRPLLAHVIERLAPQVAQVIINSSRPAADYIPFGLRVVPDTLPDQPGPLAGLLAAMDVADHSLVLAVPCDTPLLPADLAPRLLAAMAETGAPAASVRVGEQLHNAVVLVRRNLAGQLRAYMNAGGRAIHAWLAQIHAVWVDFSDHCEGFENANEPADLVRLGTRMTISSSVPLLGLAAWSGTGKTTLLERLIPELRARDMRVAVVKHAHHDFDPDTPGKDSWRLRKAGAREVLVGSHRRFFLIHEHEHERAEPRLAELLERLDLPTLDLVLVEGFKHEPIRKIELHRPALGKPLLFPDDPRVIAIASDAPVEAPLPRLDLNDVRAVADFVDRFARSWC